MWRWVFDPVYVVSSLTNWNTWLSFHWFYRPLVARLLHFQAYMQGIGRHNECEVLEMGHQDIEALAIFLGTYFILSNL